MDKLALVAAFRARLAARLEALRAGGAAARAGTRVDGDHRPENRGERAAVTTQGYLAHGLGQRADALIEDLRLLELVDLSPRDEVAAGALVRLELVDSTTETYLVLPGGQGDRVGDATVISPGSPLARALAGREQGAVVTVRRGGVEVELEIVAVA